MRFAEAEIEANSGKGRGDENFPVASRLLSGAHRAHVLAYYAFARAADDIADCPHLTPAEKLRRLEAFEAVLKGEATGLSKAERLRRSLLATGVALARATDLLVAFRADATIRRYPDAGALLDYCRHSADPVGRFLLDLHGEDPALYPASDALCTSLQILNHLQDLKPDLERLDRVYLPEPWLAPEGVGALAAGRASPVVRAAINRALDLVDERLARARGLAPALRSRSLAGEAAAITALAVRLAARLRREDPLAGRVALSRLDFARAFGGGLLEALAMRPPAAPRAVRA
ncbi:squalene/phytoene synthase family protein [Thermaurantiacus sp.]